MNGRSGIRTTKRAAALAALAAVALPAAAQARVVEPVWVTKQVNVAAGQTQTITLKCPARAVALNGAAPNAASSIPAADARRWTFRFIRSGSAVLRCVRLRLPHDVHRVSLVVGTTFEPVFEIPPGFTQTIAVRCPTGQVPTGWGLERRTDDNGLAISQATPTKHGWLFQVENTAPVGAAGSLAARCLEKKQRAPGGRHHVFATRVASFTEQIEGRGTTSRACAPNEYSVATGVSLPAAGDVLLTGTTLRGARDGEWSFSSSAGATPVRTSLICLARNTGFRR
ncbi:MAG: hypothetical protein QOE60_520 [Thermoleophilaceae bacterium]|nr:hypothetical protein [Thermoleophilaceae bacterium]